MSEAPIRICSMCGKAYGPEYADSFCLCGFDFAFDLAPLVLGKPARRVQPPFRYSELPGAERTAMPKQHIPTILFARLVVRPTKAMNSAVGNDWRRARINAGRATCAPAQTSAVQSIGSPDGSSTARIRVMCAVLTGS